MRRFVGCALFVCQMIIYQKVMLVARLAFQDLVKYP